MAAAELHVRCLLAPGAAIAALALTLGCATVTHPSATELPPVSEQPKSEEKPTRAEEPVAAPKPPTVVVIDEGSAGESETPPTLAEAARAERERRATAAKPVVRLDNKNLSEHGKDQKLTVATIQPSPEAVQAVQEVEAAARDEEYWRQRGYDIRKRWRDAFANMPVQMIKLEAGGRTMAVRVRLAATSEHQAAGFQCATPQEIERNLILFDFGREISTQFHMQNVPAALDILFAKTDGRVFAVRGPPRVDQRHGDAKQLDRVNLHRSSMRKRCLAHKRDSPVGADCLGSCAENIGSSNDLGALYSARQHVATR